MDNYHSPDRMVLAGVGIEHNTLVELGREYFAKNTPIWKENKEILDPSRGRDDLASQYTGGFIQVSQQISFFFDCNLISFLSSFS